MNARQNTKSNAKCFIIFLNEILSNLKPYNAFEFRDNGMSIGSRELQEVKEILFEL